MSDNTQELQTQDSEAVGTSRDTTLAPSMESVVEQHQAILDLMDRLMEEGKHYGNHPGTSSKALKKGGAEKICSLFQLRPDEDIHWEDLGDGHRNYVAEVTLIYGPTGQFVGKASGSCNTLESRYKNHHDHPANVYNTCRKMAFKRGLVAVVLATTAASDLFTQDIDEEGYATTSGGSGGSGSSRSQGDAFGLEDELPFKKHRGKTLKTVIDNEKGYVDWLVENVDDFEMTEEARDYYEGDDGPNYTELISQARREVYTADSQAEAEERIDEWTLRAGNEDWPDAAAEMLTTQLDKAFNAREDTEEEQSEEATGEFEFDDPQPEPEL